MWCNYNKAKNKQQRNRHTHTPRAVCGVRGVTFYVRKGKLAIEL